LNLSSDECGKKIDNEKEEVGKGREKNIELMIQGQETRKKFGRYETRPEGLPKEFKNEKRLERGE
jgi:hypothetical protein